MQVQDATLITFVAYLALILFLGIRAFRRTKDLGDYILGGRTQGPVVTALSAGASDMSGWLLLGLPGAIYLYGMSEIWIGISLAIGAYLNWLFISKPLRAHTVHGADSLTLPDYFANRFGAYGRELRIVAALVILLFFIFYTAAGLVAGAVLFENSFGLDYHMALFIGGFIIVAYTFVGGYLAVAWTDAIQALLMMLALLLAPILVLANTGGITATWQAMESVNAGSTSLLGQLGVLGLVSALAWGLGYVGQPHILARFMAVSSVRELDSARRIAMTWVVLVLGGSIATGLVGIVYFAEAPLANPETVFITLSQSLFNPWIAGIITAAILSAIMSTIDSQLLVSSSVVGKDLYRMFLRPTADDRELVAVSRGAVVVIALLAWWIAADPESRVLDLVSYAWAGFGASFGPVIVFSLFWRRMTALSAIIGMALGALTVVIWSNLSGGLFDIYEIMPGFLLASLAIVTVSLYRPEQDAEVLARYDGAEAMLNASGANE
ncbi:MAG: sodium/proline symporter PutP [Pseudohongiellaceae bacterium]